ncbi:helix-turn-helix domain-containing protein [Nonomuraea sp. SYSU D8015]|uniref:helix-turn-helix domain-containing protein n=1 Tax=Nonomuraea sp. SYSU D8015 TaxID=2593644 RepID=UPI001660CD44|nr:AraC family transcriptional regulator [Nonomuraea sp. SYSU D8015]
MRSSVLLATGPGFVVDAVTCVDHHRGWSPPEVESRYRVVLVRRGTFRRKADGRSAVADPAMAYLAVPGEEEHFAHPAGGDMCTSLSLSPKLWRTLTGDRMGPVRSTVYVDARLELAHRRLLAAARDGDVAHGVAESLLPIVGAAAARAAHTSPPAAAATRSGAASITDAAREAISADHPSAGGLLSLAEFLGVSPYQLSRAFTRELGVSLTHYRNRVRVGRALDRLEAGEPSLAVLAADLGFADQAHLTRTIRRHVGHTPTALRRLLAPEIRDPAPLDRHHGPHAGPHAAVGHGRSRSAR